MKKFFTFVAAVVAAVAVNATVVTLVPGDFAPADAGAIDQTAKEVHITISKGVINDSQIRVYKTETLTLSADKEISALVFTCTAAGDAQYGPGCFNEQDGYTYKNTTGTWVGTATKSLSFVAGKAQVRLTQIDVYFDGEIPAEDTWVADTVSVDEARALIDASDKHDHFVIGVVATAPDNTYADFNGKVNFWMTDIENAVDSLQAYQVLGENNEKWESLEAANEAIHVGDTVLMYAAALSKYGEIYEIGAGNFVKVLGANPDVKPAELDTISAAEAKARAEALKENTLSEKLVIVCYIAKIKKEFNPSYNNIDLWLNDDPTSTYGEISTFRTKVDAEVGQTLAAGDKVQIVGKLSHETYEKDGEMKHSYQVAEGAQLTLLEKAQGVENVELTKEAQKVMVDGVMYIVRDGKMFNIQGAQVR
jgi:hypothetical protein